MFTCLLVGISTLWLPPYLSAFVAELKHNEIKASHTEEILNAAQGWLTAKT
jgi:hypothetical protein